ncbi:MAG: 2-amino-4-hydroxy-6-hydroxymethyldihydropteridine diphosphokinase [Chloroflexi bacterium]|nr:2-amino-4-hydroxy-6-hydroxymethyldihydropteridine diphosphokinase [Chloroflexota bacterium]
MPKAVIAFGSNIQPERHVPLAIQRLGDHVRILAISRVYETPPVGAPHAPTYWNGALLVETDLPPRELHDRVLRGIEKELGRVRTHDPYAPRTIDLDLVLYEGVTSEDPTLPLPAPDIFRYAHVAIPVAEIAPDWPLPDQRTVADVAEELRPQSAAFRERKEVFNDD